MILKKWDAYEKEWEGRMIHFTKDVPVFGLPVEVENWCFECGYFQPIPEDKLPHLDEEQNKYVVHLFTGGTREAVAWDWNGAVVCRHLQTFFGVPMCSLRLPTEKEKQKTCTACLGNPPSCRYSDISGAKINYVRKKVWEV